MSLCGVSFGEDLPAGGARRITARAAAELGAMAPARGSVLGVAATAEGALELVGAVSALGAGLPAGRGIRESKSDLV
jgi:hypothetical protein